MKKKIFSIAFMAAIALAAGLNVSQSKSEASLSDVALSNVEALARYENPDCPNGCLTTCGFCWCNGPHGYTEYGL